MKAQTQALTAILITSVTVGAVATAFVWGQPLLEKRQSKAKLDSLERDVSKLRDEIAAVAEGGSGTSSEIRIGLDDGRVTVVPEQDYIDIQTQAQRAPYPAGSWKIIEGESPQNLTVGSGSYGIKGEDLPGVVAVKVAAGAGSNVVNYRVEFRNLKVEAPSGTRLEKVDLTSIGGKSSAGETTLQITNEGQESDTVRAETGEKFDRQLTQVSVDIR